MRLKLKFKLENNVIPLDYRRAFLSFLKKSVSRINEGKYFDTYFVGTNRKPYTFSIGLPYPHFGKTMIELSKNEMEMVFSTGDRLTGCIFHSAFIAMYNKPFPLKNNVMKLVGIQKLPDLKTESESIAVKMLSPLCIREHVGNTDVYYSSASENFEEKLNSIVKQQLLFEEFSEKLSETVLIKPINVKKTVVYHYGQYCEVTLGTFLVSGDKAVLSYILQNGMGSRKSACFGCVDLVSE